MFERLELLLRAPASNLHGSPKVGGDSPGRDPPEHCNLPDAQNHRPTADQEWLSAYLLRRVAVATDESLWSLAAGTELNVIEERHGKLLF